MGWNGVYSAGSLVPRRDVPYGDHASRLARYQLAEQYFYNTIYDQLEYSARQLKEDQRLYKFIRGIYNPVERQNNLIVSYTYRGTLDTTTLKSGSLPLIFDNNALEPALKQVMKWSNLDQQLGTYVRDAALLGDAAWWVVDDPQRRRVRLELLDPAKIKYIERDEVGNVRAVVIEYECEEEPDVARYVPSGSGALGLQKTKTFIKTIKADKDGFETYKNGNAHAFYNDAEGNPMPRWENPFGFVPLKLAYYTEGKDGWGRNSFFGTARRQIDELNDQASIINDVVRRVIEPLLQAKGVRAASEIHVKRDDKDSLGILYLDNPEGSIEAISVPIDIAGASANRDALSAELERNMPELSLQRVRDIGGNLSGVAIENLFGDAAARIKHTRRNLDPGIAAALLMAVTMGGAQGYDGFDGFDERSYDRGDMELRVADRAVIDDTLNKGERLTALQGTASLPPAYQRASLRELDFSQKDIDAMVTEVDTPTTAPENAITPANAPATTTGADVIDEAFWVSLGIPNPRASVTTDVAVD
jgi:hypothetical protein